MYTLSVKRHFDAAHFLRQYIGRCANMHGHRWQVVLKITSEELDPLGIAIDFGELKEMVKEVLDDLDHTLLNDHPAFQDVNPTAENLARFLFTELSTQVAEMGKTLTEVEVWETEDCMASYAA